MKSIEIGKVIYNILKNDKDIKAKVGDRIFPLIADNDTKFPFIVYRRSGISIADGKDKFIYTEEFSIEFAIATESYGEGVEIVGMITEAIKKIRGTINGITIKYLKITDASEDFIDDTFVQNLTLTITIA